MLMMVCGLIALVATISATLSADQSPAPVSSQGATASATARTPARELVTTYCVTCHNQRVKTGNLALDNIDADHISNSADTWEKVVVKLRSRAMPPPSARRPDNATYDRVATWLETELDRAAEAHVNPGRTAEFHRLNRTEYANAVRDLLGVEIDPKVMLPPDEQAFGFDNNADALSMQPALLDRYLAAAAKIARLVVGDPTIPAGFERYTALKDNSNETTWLWQNERLGEEFPLGSRGGIVARHFFPVDGEYVFKIRLDRTDTGLIRGLRARTDIEVRIDGVRAGQLSVGGTPELTAGTAPGGIGNYAESGSPLANADDGLEVRTPVKAGMRQVIATIVKADNVLVEGLALDAVPVWSREYTNKPDNPTLISALFIGGPYDGRLSPDSPARRRLFVCDPGFEQREPPARRRSCRPSRGAPIAARLTNEDVRLLVGFYRSARAQGDFDAGIRAGIEMVLVSPDFLFRISRDPAGAAPGTAYALPDVELASRLSFFLWSSIPDDELLDAAIRGKLHEPAVLDRQVRRMLADKRARTALVQNFFASWLQTRNVCAAHAGSQPEVPLVRRQLACGVRQGDGVIPRRSAERRSRHCRSADVESDVSQRTARPALWCRWRVWQPFPARHADR